MKRRNPTVAAIVGILIIALSLLVVDRLDRLPFVSGGATELVAEFSDSSGLERGDGVEVAGVNVGSVEDVTMGKARILVTFTIDPDIALGSSTAAFIKVSNLLGSTYLEIKPDGSGALDQDRPIPLSRTAPAYELTTAFGELTETVDQIDTDQLGEALSEVATTFEGSSEDVQASIRGLSRLTRTIAKRDEEVSSLLDGGAVVAGSLDSSKDDITSLVTAARTFLTAVDGRKEALHGLIIHTRELTEQLRGLVKDNEKQLSPALTQLEQVTTLLQKRQDQLAESVHAVAKFASVFNNTIGSGPWFDSTIGNAPGGLVVKGGP